jgi:hypothetical protein
LIDSLPSQYHFFERRDYSLSSSASRGVAA